MNRVHVLLAYRPGFPCAHSVSFSAELLFQAPLDDGDDLSSNSNNANDGSARGYYVYQFAHVLHPKMVGIREEAEAKYGSAEGEINSEGESAFPRTCFPHIEFHSLFVSTFLVPM